MKMTEKVTFERTFTTAAKQRHGAIRRRCLEFINHLKTQGFERIPLEKAKDSFQFYVNFWDRATLKAYFGTQWNMSERTIEQTTQYRNTGKVSMKTIRLRQKVPIRPGYLEKLGLVEYEWNPTSRTYFLVVKNDSPLVPEIGRMGTSIKESVCGSITNLSLNSQHGGNCAVSGEPAISVDGSGEREKRESVEGGERKSLEFGTPTLELSPYEKALLRGSKAPGDVTP